MSAVGFDFREERCVVAVAKETGIFCIDEEQCFLELDGGVNRTTRPKRSITQIMRLIVGRPFSDPELQKDLKALPFSVTEGHDGFPLIHARHLTRRSFTPIQVMGMVFSNMKGLAEKNLKAAVVDCCIGIPVYFTDHQRRAVLEAAKSAGLNPLRLMHETTATALAYGLYQRDLFEIKPLNVAFVDIGHDSMQVCIAGFKKGEMKILAHSFDRCVGGRDFDEVLFHNFAEQLKSRYEIDVFQDASACFKLRSACDKLREELRSNPEASLYVECFIDQKFVRGFINRYEFGQITNSILDRVRKPVRKALSEANIRVADDYVVEVVGLDSWVIKILKRFFGKEPRGTMNASECVSSGCALQCAILSPNYKVREFQVHEILPFPIALQWKDNVTSFDGSCSGGTEDLQNCIVFPRGNPIPSVEVRTFYMSSKFRFDLQYVDASELQAPAKIISFTIGPFISIIQPYKVEVKVGLNLHGCVYLNAQFFDETGTGFPVPVTIVEPLKGTTKIRSERGLTNEDVYECLTLSNT